MNPNAVLLSPGTIGLADAQFDMLSHKVYLDSQHQLRVVNTTAASLTEYTFDLSGSGQAVGIIGGHLCVGDITFNGPVNEVTITLESELNKIKFHHHTLGNVFSTSLDDAPTATVDLVGADDVRYQYAEANIDAPRMHYFQLSKCFVHLRVDDSGADEKLIIRFQSNLFDSGYSFQVKV